MGGEKSQSNIREALKMVVRNCVSSAVWCEAGGTACKRHEADAGILANRQRSKSEREFELA